ncbi:FAD-dependent oxidoreductase [Gemmatimonadota bacterium]
MAAAGAAFHIVPRHVLGGRGFRAPSDTLNVACIGVGGMGAADVQGMSSENIYALCDVDDERASRSYTSFPEAKRYRDFREMLEREGDSIDAVTVSTPDHTHTVAAMMALRMGKHVYCQKPLTRTIWEAQLLAAMAPEERQLSPMPTSISSFALLLPVALCFGSTAGIHSQRPPAPDDRVYDVVIYGCTSAGIAAAIQTLRLRKTPVVVCPETHLGGLTAGGLGWTDSGQKEAVGGFAREFYQRVKVHYDQPEAWRHQDPEEYDRYQAEDDAIWVFEPHVAEQTFEEMILEAGVPVFRDRWLDRTNGVHKDGTEIVSITMQSGETYHGRVFMDATYEGDLMASADVSYTIGREGNSAYGETMNGVQTQWAVSHQFDHPVSAYMLPGDPSSGLLPNVHDKDPGEDGQGDHRVQAYNFRMCLTRVPENREPFPKPTDYDPLHYELLARYLDEGWRGVFGKFDPAPNRKTDTNNHGAFSTDFIGGNYEYPDASYERRRTIIKEHEDYQKSLMWFLAYDQRVPEDVRAEMSQWGLAADEFTDNRHWPHQLYVREARRMVSDFVMTELHLRGLTPTPRVVGMGSYNMDSHNVQRYVDVDGNVRNEGDIQVNPGGPYPISYLALVPKASEATNMLVPVCLSASHIAYGSIRMEPVFMILGQSAATAAVLAINDGVSVQQVSYAQLRMQLLEDGQVLKLP